jgi:hypothetical protein
MPAIVTPEGGIISDITLVDTSSATVTYIGYADYGSLTSSPVWIIQKYDKTTSSAKKLTYADGNTKADNIWDSRTSLTY